TRKDDRIIATLGTLRHLIMPETPDALAAHARSSAPDLAPADRPGRAGRGRARGPTARAARPLRRRPAPGGYSRPRAPARFVRRTALPPLSPAAVSGQHSRRPRTPAGPAGRPSGRRSRPRPG